ncbi:MAG: universal stress protein [Fibrella sp.]|nr:universal stress protein [Armatimonadota bacterium]
MYKTILVCVDETPLSERVTRVGADLARRYGAGIVLISVVDPARVTGKTYSGLEAVQMVDQHTQTLNTSVHRLSAQLRDMGVRNRHVVVPGRSAETIMKVAETESADLIVVGSKSLGRLRAWLDNDLWSELSHKAACNVLRVTANSPTEGYNLDAQNGGGTPVRVDPGNLLPAPLSTL